MKKYRYIINNSEFPSALNRYREFHMPYKLDVEKIKSIDNIQITHNKGGDGAFREIVDSLIY